MSFVGQPIYHVISESVDSFLGNLPNVMVCRLALVDGWRHTNLVNPHWAADSVSFVFITETTKYLWHLFAILGHVCLQMLSRKSSIHCCTLKSVDILSHANAYFRENHRFDLFPRTVESRFQWFAGWKQTCPLMFHDDHHMHSVGHQNSLSPFCA